MGALRTEHVPELKGLYANSNRFTQPKGTVPRLCNLYLVRRGAFHTVPGSQWVSSWDGLAPHVNGQNPLVTLKWYSPSPNSSPDAYMTSLSAPNVTAHNYIVALSNGASSVSLIDASMGEFLTLATQAGTVSSLSNATQFGDYLILAFGNTIPPNIFPTVTQTSQAVGSGDTIINVASTIAFPTQGTIQIDSELIVYSSTTPTTFQGLTRGAYGTAAAAHAAGALVFLANAASTGAVPVTTTVTTTMLSTDTVADVAATTMFPPTGNAIIIDSEVILFNGTTSTSFENLFRGANGTTPAGHSIGATVFGVLPLSGGTGFGGACVVTAAVSAAAIVLPVTTTARFPSAGFLYVGTECIQYTGTTATSFMGLTRGVAGTTAAAHSNGDFVYPIAAEITGVGTEQVWAPIVNNFDPSTIYGGWPGSQNYFPPTDQSIANGQTAVNIGTLIYVNDGAGTAWLFRAQNSGVTGAGNDYVGPQFFPENGLIGTVASTTATSTTLTLPTGTPTPYLFTQAMVGQPITVYGAATAGGNVEAIIVSVAMDGLSLNMSVAASTTITGPSSYPLSGSNESVVGANFVIGIGHFGDIAKDEDEIDAKAKRGKGTGTEVWLNVGQAALPPPGAAFVFQHLNYLFLWGVGATYGSDGISGPDALWQSDFGMPMVFNAANTTFAGKGDGTSAQGGAVYSLSEAGIAATPQLVLFKDASTYSFLNEFPTEESLVEVSGGLGCVAPATIQFIGGYGVMRLSYAGVALFDGQLEHVTEYTDAIRGYLFGGLRDVIPVDWSSIQNCVSTQSVNPPLYMFFAPLVGNKGFVTRGFGYDFGLKQWFTMDLPWAITSAGFFPQASRALAAGFQSLVGDSSAGVVRRMFYADPDWDGTPIVWRVTMPDWGFPGTPVYVRRLNAFITPDGVGNSAKPTLTSVFFNGIRRSSQAFGRFLNLPRSLLGSADVGETVLSGNVSFVGTGQVLIEGSDAQVSDKPTARVGL